MEMDNTQSSSGPGLERLQLEMGWCFMDFLNDVNAEAEYKGEMRRLAFPRVKRNLSVLWVGSTLWAVVVGLGSSDFLSAGLSGLTNVHGNTGWCFVTSVVLGPYLLLMKFPFSRSWMRLHLFESVTIVTIFEFVFLWLEVFLPDYALAFPDFANSTEEHHHANSAWCIAGMNSTLDMPSPDFLFGVGLTDGTLGSALPCMFLLAFQLPPRHSLVTLIAWLMAAIFVGYECFKDAGRHFFAYFAGHVVIVLCVAIFTFLASRADDKMRRIMFSQRLQLRKAHIEIVTDVRDPFRVSNLRRWMMEGSADGAESGSSTAGAVRAVTGSGNCVGEGGGSNANNASSAHHRQRSTGMSSSDFYTSNQSKGGGVVVPYEHLQLGVTLGAGASGCVLAAEYFATQVAVKQVFMEMSEVELDLLSREVSILVTIRHPNIVSFIGLSKSPRGELLIITERCDVDLMRLLSRSKGHCGAVNCKAFVSMAKQIAASVNFLHARGIVHRDLKVSTLPVLLALCLYGAVPLLSHTHSALTTDRLSRPLSALSLSTVTFAGT
jgi:hypothetical protein